MTIGHDSKLIIDFVDGGGCRDEFYPLSVYVCLSVCVCVSVIYNGGRENEKTCYEHINVPIDLTRIVTSSPLSDNI